MQLLKLQRIFGYYLVLGPCGKFLLFSRIPNTWAIFGRIPTMSIKVTWDGVLCSRSSSVITGKFHSDCFVIALTEWNMSGLFRYNGRWTLSKFLLGTSMCVATCRIFFGFTNSLSNITPDVMKDDVNLCYRLRISCRVLATLVFAFIYSQLFFRLTWMVRTTLAAISSFKTSYWFFWYSLLFLFFNWFIHHDIVAFLPIPRFTN